MSILNDSKYGFATLGNVMRLSLLRSPKAPDGHADMGRHTIRYALLPHRVFLVESTNKKVDRLLRQLWFERDTTSIILYI